MKRFFAAVVLSLVPATALSQTLHYEGDTPPPITSACLLAVDEAVENVRAEYDAIYSAINQSNAECGADIEDYQTYILDMEDENDRLKEENARLKKQLQRLKRRN